MVAFLGLSAQALATHGVHDPHCDQYDSNHNAAVYEFGLDNPITDSSWMGAAASITGSAHACGSFLGPQGTTEGDNTMYKRADITVPPGVEIADSDLLPHRSYAGEAWVNMLFRFPDGRPYFAGGENPEPYPEGIPSVITTDYKSECARESELPASDIISCLKGENPFGHNWSWSSRDASGKLALTVGPMYSPGITVGPGLTYVTLYLCGNYGSVVPDPIPDPNPNRTDCGTDGQFQQLNGDASAPNCDNGNGIYSVTATTETGFTTDPTTDCVEWEAEVDQDCDGDPYGNDFLIHDFSVSTNDPPPSPYRIGGANMHAPLNVGALVCGTALGSNDTGASSLTDHVDMLQPPGSRINGSYPIGYVPNGSYAGTLDGRLATHDASGNPVIEETTASLEVEPVVLRVLGDTYPVQDNCNREAEDLNRNSGNTAPGSGLILTCAKAQSAPGSPVAWSSYVWSMVSNENGRTYVTMGPIHIDGQPDRDAGLTEIDEFKICGYAGDVGGSECGPRTNRGLHKNGDASPAGCINGRGLFEVTATNKAAEITPDPAGDVVSDCVRWIDLRKAISQYKPVSVSLADRTRPYAPRGRR